MKDESIRLLTTRQVLKKIIPYLKRQPGMVLVCTLSVFAAAITSRALPWILGKIVDEAILPKNKEAFLSLAFLYLFMEGLKILFQFSQNYSFQIFGNRMLYEVRSDLQAHVLKLPMSYFNQTPIGRIVTRMTNDIASLGELFSDGVIRVLTSSMMLLSTVVGMFLISPKLACVTLVTAPVFIFITWKITERLRLLLHQSKAKVSALNSFLAENIAGIKIIQLYNQVDEQNAKFADLTREEKLALRESIRGYALMQPVLNLFNGTVVTASLLGGGYFFLQGDLALGALMTFILYAQDFIQPIRDILEKIQQLQNASTSAERVFHLFDEIAEPPSAAGTELEHITSLKGEIQFQNLTFRYSQDRDPAIRHLNLKIDPGQSVALVGRTGSGKTTLVSLLQRFYEPPPKTIFIDQVPIEQFDRRSLRKRLGVIQQDPLLFRGNVLDNICLENPQITENEALKAAKQVGLKLPMNAEVQERGQNLSMGERQLISFARILVFNPEILILDEATSNVDPQTELRIQEATREVMKGRTCLIIAHRLATVQDCDRVLVLDNGKLVEDGRPQELAHRDGPFAQLQRAHLNEGEI